MYLKEKNDVLIKKDIFPVSHYYTWLPKQNNTDPRVRVWYSDDRKKITKLTEPNRNNHVLSVYWSQPRPCFCIIKMIYYYLQWAADYDTKLEFNSSKTGQYPI